MLELRDQLIPVADLRSIFGIGSEAPAQSLAIVVRTGGQVIGYIDRCPHTGMPLALFDNFLTREKDLILCSSHGALFEPKGGKCVAGPCAGRFLWAWPVKVEGGDVVVG